MVMFGLCLGKYFWQESDHQNVLWLGVVANPISTFLFYIAFTFICLQLQLQ